MKDIWNLSFAQNLRTILRNVGTFTLKTRKHLIRFIRVVEYYQIKYGQLIYIIYDGMKELTQEILICCGQQGLEKRLDNFTRTLKSTQTGRQLQSNQLKRKFLMQIRIQSKIKEEHKVNKLLGLYIKQLSERLNGPYQMLISLKNNTKQLLSDCMNQLDLPPSHMSYLQDLLIVLEHQQLITIPLYQQIMSDKDFFGRIQQTVYKMPTCLGCLTFVPQNTNIVDKNHVEIPYRLLPSIKHVKQLKEQLVECGVSLLNKGGGVILFGTKEKYMRVFGQGQKMTAYEMEQSQNQIHKILGGSIYPSLSPSLDIDVSFLPKVRLSPNSDQISIISGVFIGRVTLKPKDMTVTYFKKSGKMGKACFGDCKNTKTHIRTIKRKIRQYHLPEHLDSSVKEIFKRPTNNFEHQCQKMHQEAVRKKDFLKSQILSVSRSHGKEEFAHISLVRGIASTNVPQLQSRLRIHRVECKVSQYFKSYRFSSSHLKAVIEHNLSPSKLKQVLFYKNPDFLFGGNEIHLTSVTRYIHLIDRTKSQLPMEQVQIQRLKEWMHHQFPDEKIQQVTVRIQESSQCKYFLKSQTLKGSLFAYFILQNFNQRCHFEEDHSQSLISEVQFEGLPKLSNRKTGHGHEDE